MCNIIDAVEVSYPIQLALKILLAPVTSPSFDGFGFSHAFGRKLI